jgi:hypothetical protein
MAVVTSRAPLPPVAISAATSQWRHAFVSDEDVGAMTGSIPTSGRYTSGSQRRPLSELARYERASDPLAPRRTYFRRVSANFLLAACLVALSLTAGMAGYHFLGHLVWIDAFLNAAMILSGMGPVDVLTDAPAKLFAGLFALYSGLTLVAAAGLILAPILHRFLHRFHLEDENDER